MGTGLKKSGLIPRASYYACPGPLDIFPKTDFKRVCAWERHNQIRILPKIAAGAGASRAGYSDAGEKQAVWNHSSGGKAARGHRRQNSAQDGQLLGDEVRKGRGCKASRPRPGLRAQAPPSSGKRAGKRGRRSRPGTQGAAG